VFTGQAALQGGSSSSRLIGSALLLLFLFAAQIFSQEFPAMFVLVAIDAEVLPVGAVRRIIPGIAVLVVHS
jgi:hypothetical protein